MRGISPPPPNRRLRVKLMQGGYLPIPLDEAKTEAEAVDGAIDRGVAKVAGMAGVFDVLGVAHQARRADDSRPEYLLTLRARKTVLQRCDLLCRQCGPRLRFERLHLCV
jgi:hypothetical protein